MQNAINSSTPVTTRLKDWVVANNAAKALKKPRFYEGSTEYERRSAEFDNRTEVADKICDMYLENDETFTSIMNEICHSRNASSRGTHCSAIREVLRELQAEARAHYMHPSNARFGKVGVI